MRSLIKEITLVNPEQMIGMKSYFSGRRIDAERVESIIFAADQIRKPRLNWDVEWIAETFTNMKKLVFTGEVPAFHRGLARMLANSSLQHFEHVSFSSTRFDEVEVVGLFQIASMTEIRLSSLSYEGVRILPWIDPGWMHQMRPSLCQLVSFTFDSIELCDSYQLIHLLRSSKQSLRKIRISTCALDNLPLLVDFFRDVGPRLEFLALEYDVMEDSLVGTDLSYCEIVGLCPNVTVRYGIHLYACESS
jgi:hypothetical protein